MKRSHRRWAVLALVALAVASLNWSRASAAPDESTPPLVPWGEPSPDLFAGAALRRAQLSASGLAPAAVTPGVTLAGFNAVTPQRVLDTRNGIGAPRGPVGPGQSIDVAIAGQGGVPIDASSVVLNVTVTQATVGGFITVWPTGAPRPTASSLNMTANETIPNAVIAKLGVGGKVSLYNDTGDSQLVADITGYTRADGHYIGLSPAASSTPVQASGGAGPSAPRNRST